MSTKFLFDLPQSPHFRVSIHSEAYFNDTEVEAIKGLWQDETVQPATVYGSGQASEADKLRQSNLNFLTVNPENNWLFNKLGTYAIDINNKHYYFALSGFLEPLQLARYGQGHFFDWHLDFTSGHPSTRKLSVSVQVSDGDEYEGGDFEFFINGKIFRAPRTKGTVIIFPSFIQHRVTPVTKGERFSVVGWVNGPTFR